MEYPKLARMIHAFRGDSDEFFMAYALQFAGTPSTKHVDDKSLPTLINPELAKV